MSKLVGKVNRDLVEEKEIGIMSEKITRENRKFKFETLQLHVGQEQPDRLQMQEQFRFTRHHLMYSATAIMQQQDLVWQMLVTFTDV